MPEEQIATENPDAFEITTSGESVTGKRLFADGGDGQEKEVNVTRPSRRREQRGPGRAAASPAP